MVLIKRTFRMNIEYRKVLNTVPTLGGVKSAFSCLLAGFLTTEPQWKLLYKLFYKDLAVFSKRREGNFVPRVT